MVMFVLGSVDKGIIEVTNCFCVPHKEHDDQVEAELSYALDVYELNRRVNSSENIIGESSKIKSGTWTCVKILSLNFAMLV